MAFFRVTVRRTDECEFYIQADSHSQAIEDAEELANSASPDEWIQVEQSWDDIKEIDVVPEHEEYWSGGPEGEMVPA